MCVACRRRRPPGELVRFVATPEGVRPDDRRRAQGRGAYLCPETTCIEAAARRGGKPLRQALRGVSDRDAAAALEALHQTHRARQGA